MLRYSDPANPVGTAPEEFAAFIRAERARWGKVVREASLHISQGRKTFEQTVRAYGADLYRYAHSLCRRHMAEDVMQEDFARAWKAWLELRDAAQATCGIEETELPAVPSFEAGLETAQIVGNSLSDRRSRCATTVSFTASGIGTRTSCATS